jgi:ATP-dependent DNA helicase PIF1
MKRTLEPLSQTIDVTPPQFDKRKADSISPRDKSVKRVKQQSIFNSLAPPQSPESRQELDSSSKDSKEGLKREPIIIDLTGTSAKFDSQKEQEETNDELHLRDFDALPKDPGPKESPINTEELVQPVKEITPRPANDSSPNLCPEQQDLVDLILSGANVFYTGSAGCGKSTVLKAAVRKLRAEGRRVRIVAPTGRAAVDIGGQTIHTFAGLTPDSLKVPLAKLREKAHGRLLNRRFKFTEVLIIDEISMVENHFLERINAMLQEARHSDKAFGGMQMVVLGDFYQCMFSSYFMESETCSNRIIVPPVKPFQYCIECGREMRQVIRDRVYKCSLHGEFRDEDKWAFRSKCWEKAKFTCVNLSTIHRQHDPKFIALLEKCRKGMAFNTTERNVLLHHQCNFTEAVRLYATREEVRRINDEQFRKLDGEKLTFKALDGIEIKDRHIEQLRGWNQRGHDGSLIKLKDHRLEKLLELKKGTHVILLLNLAIESGLVNGTQGVIISWEDMSDAKTPISHTRVGPDEMNPRQVIYGRHADTKEAGIKGFIQMQSAKKWPRVRFENGVEAVIMADCQVTELGDTEPYSLICRAQIPLLPAWAMSIHKSQGMTLSKVIVDLSRNFEEGQVYVALSRAKSLDGLKVLALGQDQSGPNYEVMSFLDQKFGTQTKYVDIY